MDSRNNIMFRKPKAYTGRNDTTAETQYQAEQARLQALRQRREGLVEEKRIDYCGSSDERYHKKSQVNQEAQYQLNIKTSLIQEEIEKKREAERLMEVHRQKLINLDRQRDMERKMKLRQIQEENRLAALAKNYDNIHKKIKEDRRDRETIEKNIYNYAPNVL